LRRVEEFLVSIKNFISFHKFSLQENNSCQKTKEQLTPNPKNNEKKNKEIPKSVPILGPKSKKKIFLTYARLSYLSYAWLVLGSPCSPCSYFI